jgi:hypothetical protein
MKPTSHATSESGCFGAHQTEANKFPVTDFNYQSLTLDGFRGGCIHRCEPSFRRISEDYFKNEARRSFVTEAAFFALMVVISSWPIVQSVRAMGALVRAYAGI